MPFTYLKDNEKKVHQAVKEVFNADSTAKFKGELLDFNYTEDDCSDMREYGFTDEPENKGPGIRVEVRFTEEGMDGERVFHFYYAENECPTLESFIDNLNTDFAMAQIRLGTATKGLGIRTYDLNQNSLTIQMGTFVETLKVLDKCWDVDKLTFNVQAFQAIRSQAQERLGMYSVYRSMGLFSEAPVPLLPPSIQLLGIDKSRFKESPAPK